jgi:Tfp pilus assembly protein PilF
MRKQTILAIVIGLGVIGAGFWYYQNNTSRNGKEDRNLTSEQENKYEDGITKTEDAIKSVNPEKPGANMELANLHMQLGQQYFGLGQLSKAEQEYAKALEADPKNAQIYVAMSLSQSDREDFAAARASLEKAVELDPSVADIWLRYLVLLKDRFPEAKAEMSVYYDKALKATNRHTDVLVSYAQHQESVGKNEEAKVLWKEAADATGNSVYLNEYKRLGGK